MPSVSGNVGAVFNGGTISTPLVVSPGNKDAVSLQLKPTTGATSDATNQLEVYDDAGNLLGTWDALGDFFCKLPATSGASFTVDLGTHAAIDVEEGSGLVILSGKGAGAVRMRSEAGDVVVDASAAGTLGFFATTPAAQPTVTGSKGANAALTSLCTALATLGLIVNNTT